MNEAKTIEVITGGGARDITITPVLETIGDASFLTGIYKLHEGPVGLGEINYDVETGEWQYDAIDGFTRDQVETIISVIREQTEKGQ
jgi:hypothetical protein